MYPTRKERLAAQRKRKQLIWRKCLLFFGVLLCIAGVAAYLLYPAEQPPSAPKHASSVPPENLAEQPDPFVTLTFVGDVMMTGRVEALLKEKGFAYPFAHVNSLFLEDDYTIANLETPVTRRGTPAGNKEYVYKSPPEAVPAMKAAGIDLVNLANNHSLDQGEEGLLDTFQHLGEQAIAYVGAGIDQQQAYAPVFIERNGIRIAFLGLSRVVPHVSWYAGKDKPGVAATYDPTLAQEAIRQAKDEADLVVVLVHWGQEKTDYPVDHQKVLARAYIDAGADLVIGGHPHVLQGFERYKDKWIAYSMGNFIFTRSQAAKTWETMVLQATCTKAQTCQLQMTPFHAELGQAVPMNERDGAALRKRIESISVAVDIDDDGKVTPRP